ncbi:MAG: urease accessory protein UreD [Pseudomonadota bacterium]
MFDTAPSPGLHQRAHGSASAALSLRGGAVRLDRLRQQGCAKAFLPRVEGPPEVVFLNTAGGLTGGDRLRYDIELGPGAHATATTQTAERAYAATPGATPAKLHVDARVAAGATLDWLPQETILFDRASLERHTRLELQGDASLLMCEALVLGRAAMGETVETLNLFDRRMVTRDGRPVLVDAVDLDTASLQRRGRPAGLADARAVATLALVAQGAEDAATALRGIALPEAVRAGVSGWDGKCVVRLMAKDGWPLRVALATLLGHLRAGRGTRGALPRVWQI